MNQAALTYLPDKKITAKIIETVIGGAGYYRFSVTVENPDFQNGAGNYENAEKKY